MNENIGVKGDRNDRRRTNIIISENQKKVALYNKKLKEEKLKRLEKRVKKQQIINFFIVLPLLATTKTLDTIYKNVSKKKNEETIESLEEQPLDQIRIKEITFEKYKLAEKHTPKIDINLKKEKEEHKAKIRVVETVNKEETKDYLEENKQTENIEHRHNIGISPRIEKDYDNLTNKKILTEYETRLKDIRNDLKKITYEFKLLEIEKEENPSKEDVEVLLDKINIVIGKINSLENKISFDNCNFYDDHYIEQLVSEYIEQFNNKKFIEEIKDSDLYILISEKILKLEEEKNKLKDKIDSEKDKLEITTEAIDKRKKEFYDFENINNELLKIQYEQDYALKELEEKIKNAKSVEEKVQYQIKFMKIESDKILKKMARPRLIPGVRSGKIGAFLGATFLFFAKKVRYPKLERKKYKVITIKDYTSDLETNTEKIVSTKALLEKTSNRIDNMIKEFSQEYEDYIDSIPDTKKLIDNLYSMKEMLKEKEYEIEKITHKQQQLVNKNKEKIKQKEDINF